jgi:hypothetical protein
MIEAKKIKAKAPQSAPFQLTLGFKRMISKPISKEKTKGMRRVRLPPIILPRIIFDLESLLESINFRVPSSFSPLIES